MWLLFLLLAANRPEIPNPNIDMPGYLRIAHEAADYRTARRVTEEEFLRLSCEPGAVILDARSSEKYRELHVKGAVNLSFPDITAASLAEAIPDASAPVLIYCNNNFRNAERAFPGKASTASLNLSTFIALYNYGYRNVFELGPLVDIEKSRLPFEGTEAIAADRRISAR
jgi:Rhodanese-like domain